MNKNIEHPYIGRNVVSSAEESRRAVKEVNDHRDNARPPHVEVTYYFEACNDGKPMEGLKNVATMTLEHGTLKPWAKEGDPTVAKPSGYDDCMSWATDISLFRHDPAAGKEQGTVTIAYPLPFFDKTGPSEFPLAQMMMAVASEPVSAFTTYRAAKIVDMRFPAELKKKFPGVAWSHRKVRDYLRIGPAEPIIGTIVKPKTGLTPELFSRCVVEAAVSGAKFAKADENMHLTLKEVPVFVGRTVADLEKAGFDLGSGTTAKPRFLFAPHITANPDRMMDYARAAVEAGANALMFSPHYGGGFLKLAEVADAFKVPVYAHTAGMNMMTGCPSWGMDARVMYVLTALFGGAFMQLPAMNGYIRPEDVEKPLIIRRLQEDGLEGDDGMTLVIAGGLGPANIGVNMKVLGMRGRMFLAGTSVYSHPDGPSSGVKALIAAYRAFVEKGITDTAGLLEYGRAAGEGGRPLVRALEAKG